MISVKVVKENSNVVKVSVLGHAMYDEYGKDIVCSACSSIVTTTVNGILSLNKESLSYFVSKKGMEIEVKAPKAGTVQSVLVAPGDKVVNGSPLVTLG